MKIFIYISLALCAIMFHPLKVCAANESGVAQIQCKECDKTLLSKQNLKLHMRTHTGEKPYKCKECDKSFAKNSNLTRHMPLHTKKKSFECEVCGKCFSDNSNCKRHMQTHTGDKPFKCTECDKYFAQRANLNMHKRTHTGEKPYECTICGTPFSQACNLKNHITTHTKEKPHKCKECKKCFTRKDFLTRHIQNKHLEQSPQTSKHSSMSFVQNNDSKEDRSQCNNPVILEDQATNISDGELNKIIKQCAKIFCTIENKTPKETPYKIREFLWRLNVYSEILQEVLKLSVGTVLELEGNQIVSLSKCWIKLIYDKTSLPCNKEMLSTDQDANDFHAITKNIYRILDDLYLLKQADTQEEIQQKEILILILILIEDIRGQLFLIDPHLKEGLTDQILSKDEFFQ